MSLKERRRALMIFLIIGIVVIGIIIFIASNLGKVQADSSLYECTCGGTVEAVSVAATCEEPAKTKYICQTCGTVIGSINVSGSTALGHKWEYKKYNLTNHKKSCTRTGCEYSEEEGHDWGEWEKTDSQFHKHVCILCEQAYSTTHEFPTTGTITKQPTCTFTGTKVYYCITCGGQSDPETIDMLAHKSDGVWRQDGKNGHYQKCATCTVTVTSDTHKYTESIVSEPTCTSAGTKKYTCSVCTYSYTETYGEASGHNYQGGNCEERATCANGCGVPGDYGDHSYSAATCEEPAICIYCENPSGKELGHTGGNHDNNGVCQRTGCGKTYQEHKKSEEIAEYDKTAVTEDTHTPLYKCLYENCTGKYTGEPVAHSGGSHPEGICEACNHEYQNHSQSTEIKEYEKNTTTHTPIYKCTEQNCQTTYKGEAEEHNVNQWTDEKDGTHSGTCTNTGCGYKVINTHNYINGLCADCKAKEPIEECEHIYQMEKDENGHREKCTECFTTKPGSIQDHTVSRWQDNGNGKHSGNCSVCGYTVTQSHNFSSGECQDCNAKESTIEECQHNYIRKTDENYHWEECSKSDCNKEKPNSKEKHTIATWINNTNGTHSGTCTECNYIITDNHTNGTTASCSKCNYTVNTPNGDNANDQNNNNGSTNNGDGTTGNNNSNNNGGANDNSNNNGGNNSSTQIDDTQANTSIPQTGINSIVIISSVVTLIILATITVTKINKYRDVK